MKTKIVCNTRFTVFQKMYETISASQVPIESIVEPSMFTPDDIVQLTLSPDCTNSKTAYVYNPLEDTPELFLELAKVSNLKELLQFINIYGLPTGKSKKEINSDTEQLIVYDMDIFDFFVQVETLHELVSLWFSIQNGETPTEKEFNWLVETLHEAGNSLTALDVIAKTLNAKRNWDSSFKVFDEITETISFHSLIDVAYFQLSEAILTKIPLRRCLNCNSVFAVFHESQKFCPPRLNRKRSTCENSYRIRKSRQRQKESK
jgi:hypothetical protein